MFSHPNSLKRKLIEFAPEIWLALELLAKDTGRDVQDLAEEAFADLLGKYHRPASLRRPYAKARADCRPMTTCRRRADNTGQPWHEFARHRLTSEWR